MSEAFVSLKIAGFRSHRETSIDGLRRVNWFLGKNGTGKSSIIDAIAYAFTGVCRGTDRGGRGADDLVTDFRSSKEPNRFQITVAWKGGRIVRTGPGEGPTSKTQQDITGHLGVQPQVFQALTDVSRLLEAAPREQQAILEQVLGIVVTPDVVAKATPHPELTQGFPLASLDDLIAFEQHARNERLLARRLAEGGPRRRDQPATTPDFSQWSLDDLRKGRVEVEAKLRDYIEKRAVATAAPNSARKKAIEASLSRLEKEIALQTRHLSSIPDPMPAIREAIGEMKRRQDVLGALEQAQPTGNKADDSVRVRLLQAYTTACFLCGRKFTGKTYTEALVTASLAAEQHGQGVLGMTEQRGAIKDLDRRLANLQLDQDKRNAAERDIKIAAEQILTLKSELHSLQDEVPVDSADFDARIGKGQAVLAAVEEHIKALEWNLRVDGQIAALAESVMKWENMVDGLVRLRQELVEGRIKGFQEKANIILGVMGFKAEFSFTPFAITVNGRKPTLLSETQRLKVGLGLQMTLANLAGLKFVCVDRLDALDSEGGEAIKEIVRKVKQFQFFLCATSDDPDAMTKGADDDWAVYRVSLNGQESKVDGIA